MTELRAILSVILVMSSAAIHTLCRRMESVIGVWMTLVLIIGSHRHWRQWIGCGVDQYYIDSLYGRCDGASLSTVSDGRYYPQPRMMWVRYIIYSHSNSASTNSRYIISTPWWLPTPIVRWLSLPTDDAGYLTTLQIWTLSPSYRIILTDQEYITPTRS